MSISIQKAKELIDDPKLSDEEVREIMGSCQAFVEIVFEEWIEKRKILDSIINSNE